MSALKVTTHSSPQTTQSNIPRLKTLEQRFNEQLFDQTHAVGQVCDILTRIVTGFYNDKTPLGVLLFAGPTGVGKTELAKMMANELGIPFHRYDMTEFQHEHHVSRFLGSPPGYVGSQNGGELVRTLKASPVCVVLFDEIEKAHPSIFNVFLQLFDEGRLTDATGHHVSTKNVIFIMTTNMGTRVFYQNSDKSQAQKQEMLKSLFIRRFSPELFNRIQHSVVFNSLDKDAFAKIARKHLRQLTESIGERKQLTITWEPNFEDAVSRLESDKDMGARGFQRKINDFVLPALAKSYMRHEFFEGGQIVLALKDGSAEVYVKVLEKGNPIAPLIQEAAPELPSNKRMIFYKHGESAKNLEGKYAFRVARCNGDGSYRREPIKIDRVTPTGDIIYFQKFIASRNEEQARLDADWNDDQWMMAIPSVFPKEFFENLSTTIDLDQREGYIKLVREIFKELKVKHLPDDNPLAELKKLSKNNAALTEKVEALTKMVGDICVAVEAPVQKAALSPNYHLPFLQSKL